MDNLYHGNFHDFEKVIIVDVKGYDTAAFSLALEDLKKCLMGVKSAQIMAAYFNNKDDSGAHMSLLYETGVELLSEATSIKIQPVKGAPISCSEFVYDGTPTPQSMIVVLSACQAFLKDLQAAILDVSFSSVVSDNLRQSNTFRVYYEPTDKVQQAR